MKKTNRLFSFILSVIMLSTVLVGANLSVNAQDYAQELRNKGFPESYINQLVELHKLHPRWNFEPLNTRLDWQDAVDGERSYHSKQLIEKSADKEYLCDCPECFVNGEYVIREGSTWVAASEKAVKYYMDPRNFLDEKNIFQFETTKFNSEETIEGIEAIIASTWMNHADITYKDAAGNDNVFYLNGSTVKYSQAIYDAARDNNVGAYYLASKIVQEVGGKLPTAGGASGTYPGYEGIYNYYNIRANSGVVDGLAWASKNNNTTNSNCNIRTQPWVADNSLGIVDKGTEVKIIAETGKQNDGYTWYQVETKLRGGQEVTGYIRSDLIDVSGKADEYNRPWTNPYLSITNGAKYIVEGFSKYQYTGYLQKFNVNNVEGNRLHSHEYMTNVRGTASEARKTYNANVKAQTLDDNKLFYIPVFYNMPDDSSSMPDNTTVNNLSIYDIYPTRLIYVWDEVPNAVRYEFYIKNNTKGTSFSATRYTNYADLKGLTEGHNYTVYVKPIILDPQTQTEYEGASVAINNTTFSTRDGWNARYGEWYFDYGDGLHSNGWRTVNGNWFYFYPNAMMAHDTEMADSRGICYLDSNGYIVTNSWQYSLGGWRYFDNNGYLVVNSVVNNGDGNRYIDENGFLITDRWMTDEFGKFYLDENGYVARNRWFADSNGWFYLGSSGRIVKNDWVESNGKYYYMGEGGYMVAEQFVKDKIGLAYVDQNGVRVNNSWIWYDNGWMYAGENGYMLTNEIAKDSHGLVYLDENGRMTANRWVLLDQGWIYVDENGYLVTNGLARDWYDLCFLDANGIMVTNRWIMFQDGWSYFDADGHIVRNNIADDSRGTVYLDENGKMTANRWVLLDQGWIFVDENGYLVKDKMVEGVYGTCYLAPDGFMLENSWGVIDGKWMYFGESGYMAKDRLIPCLYGTCYVDVNGLLVENSWIIVDGGWMYAGQNGYIVVNDVVKDSHGLVYLDENGRMIASRWVLTSDGWIYVDANGYLVTDGLAKDWYDLCYLDANGIMVTNRWIMFQDGWSYFDADGHIVRNNTANDSLGTVYLDENGKMTANRWIKLDRGWIYVDENGYLVKDKLVNAYYGSCYLDSNGIMVTDDWVLIDGTWCYFDANGYLSKTK